MPDWDLVRCVVFDFDGTLVASNPIKRGVFREIFAPWHAGSAVVEQVLAANPRDDRFGVVAKAVAAILQGERRTGEPAPDAEALVAAYSRICDERVAACAAMPGADDALTGLRDRGVPRYVASATPRDALLRIVERRGWSRLFTKVFGGPASKHENLEAIAECERLGPSALLFIGDGEADRAAAASFGCAFLGAGVPDPSLALHPKLGVLGPLVASLTQGRTVS